MQTVTPSQTQTKITTAGQIDKAVGNYRALLEKHSKDFYSEAVQLVLGQSELADEQFQLFRARVEAHGNIIVRHVRVDRSRTPKKVLTATGRNQHVTDSVVETMPKGEREEVHVHFFKLGRFVNDADLEKEYTLRDLKPADPYSQAAVNEADPAFADEHPNGTHWKDADDNWCFATFSRWFGDRSVIVHRIGHGWLVGWWFAGLRK